MLNLIRHGQPTGAPPLVIAHGLFGSARNWNAVARRFAARRETLVVDMRNHGESFRDPVHSYEAMAGDLAAVIAAEAGGRADVLGHSMGGKAAMALALTAPERVGRLVVDDIAPVRYGHSQIGYVRAMEALDLSGVRRRSDADAALAASVPEPGVRAFLIQSLALTQEGAAWKLNLDALGDQMPGIMDFPDLPGRFEGQTLFLVGGASDYVRDAHRPEIEARFPAARIEALPGVGHWLHAEAPEAFVAAVEAFLAE
ncbi:alpha/beta fold hydrolase [Amaricoccus sp.]|uniref:alpha/beta fold hydrolase n=1 Tax=Amaricoccus sp. TaxID=1872485 RepID=UPI001B5F7967|nr:alpha/beta fold hydrolase [Amaricoccus sp.]MBP7000261.1 alpha/beta fold hydrolase [Amaricoccus sp.]